RMADADAQAVECAGAEMLEDVAQSVLPAVAAVEFQPHRAGRKVEIVVHHQHFLRFDIPVTQRARDRNAALVHEGGPLQQPHLLAADSRARGFRVQRVLETEARVRAGCQCVDEPEPGVVPGAQVFGARVAEAGDEADCHERKRGAESRERRFALLPRSCSPIFYFSSFFAAGSAGAAAGAAASAGAAPSAASGASSTSSRISCAVTTG